MAIAISMPLFSQQVRIAPQGVAEYLASHWDDVPRIGKVEGDDERFTFGLGDGFVAIGMMDAPFPWSDLEGPCATSILWPKATEQLRDHKSHAIVTVSSESQDAVGLSRLLTQVTAAVLATADACLGVYWGNATLIVPRDLFVEFALEILPQGAPIHIWIDFRVGPDEGNTSTGFTTGMAALDLMELEAVRTPESPKDLYDRLNGLADYLITNGNVIKDGDTVGNDENEKIKVRHEASHFGHEGNVISLKYETPKRRKKKGWFR